MENYQQQTQFSVGIVGGGLSGLSAAFQLQKLIPNIQIEILEGRNRVGGRIYSENNVDLGAAWHWSQNDKALLELGKNVNVGIERQFYKGRAICEQDQYSGVCGDDISPSGGNRFQGSAMTLINNLKAMLEQKSFKIFYEYEVKQIKIDEKVQINNDKYYDAVIVAVPPRLVVNKIQFTPDLSQQKKIYMEQTPTWMSNTGKIAFIYDSKWWINENLSGTGFSDIGPIAQIWDNSDEFVFALAGFVFDDNLKYFKQKFDQNNPLYIQMNRIFGQKSLKFKQIIYKSWIDDEFTSVGDELSASYKQKQKLTYGNPQTIKNHQNKVFFAGTETQLNENGHMNGAVLSGYRSAQELFKLYKELY